jgi:hypothetical protein
VLKGWFGAVFVIIFGVPRQYLLNLAVMTMKKIVLLFAMIIGGWALTPVDVAQVISTKGKLSGAEKKALRQKSEAESISRINDLIANLDFVLVPNQVSGNDVNPVMNFIRVSGNSLIFQTSSPVDRTKSNNWMTDKTVMGKVTSKSVKTNPNSGYHLVKLNVMTELGIGFRIDMKISPFGNATASVTTYNSAGNLEYYGRIVPWENSDISIGAESIDLRGFPWYTNPIGVRWVDR